MSVIRVAKRARFTTIDRETVRDQRLSFRALGLLTWLLDKPDDYGVSADQIAGAGPDGRDAVRTTLAELQCYGYLERKRIQDPETGRWGWEHVVYERPRVCAGQPEDGSTDDGLPEVGPPDDGAPEDGEGVLSRKTQDLLTPPVVPPKRRQRPPRDFQPTDEHRRLCSERNLDVDAELGAWLDWCEANGKTFAVVNAGFSTWIRNAPKYGGAKSVATLEQLAEPIRRAERPTCPLDLCGGTGFVDVPGTKTAMACRCRTMKPTAKTTA